MRKKYFAFCVWSQTVILSAGISIYAQTVEVLIKNAEAAIEKRDYDAALNECQ